MSNNDKQTYATDLNSLPASDYETRSLAEARVKDMYHLAR